MDLEAFPQVNSRKTEGFRRKRDPCIVDRSGGQCFIDPPVGGLLAAVDALRVHPQQHLHTVTCMFRMAHVFLALGQIDQAHHVATSTAQALEPKITQDAEPEVLSLYGALHPGPGRRRRTRQQARRGPPAPGDGPEDRRAARRGPRRRRHRVRPHQRRHPRRQHRRRTRRRRTGHRARPARHRREPVTGTTGPVLARPGLGPRHAKTDRRSPPRSRRSRAHRTGGNPWPLRRTSRRPRPAPALRATPQARTTRPRRALRSTTLTGSRSLCWSPGFSRGALSGG